VTDNDLEIRFDYLLDSDSTSTNPELFMYFRYEAASGKRMKLSMRRSQASIHDYDGMTWAQLDVDTIRIRSRIRSRQCTSIRMTTATT